MIINFGMILGKVLRKLAHRLIKRYYPKVQITGAEQIPSDGPILFCANHPNSLIDPILIGITAKRPVSFMAKAPLFKTPILGSIMYALGMVPAYRGRDDSSQVKKNQKSLDRVIKGLMSGRAMGIFPEGVSSDLRQLGLVRGGASRIALGAFEGGVENLVIVPLGINYERKEKLGSKVWINVGEPILMKEFTQENRSDEEKAITDDKVLRRKLTQQIETNLKTVIVHLDNAEWDPLLDDLETLVEHSRHKASLKVPKLMRRKRIADALNYFYREEAETGTEVVSQIQNYHHKVRAAGLIIDDPILQRSTLKTTFTILFKFVHLIVWFIPALLGTLGNIVPFVITRAIASKVQQEGLKTTALARIGVGLPIYLLWYALIAYTVWMETAQPVLITVTNFLLLLSGTISLKYWPYCVKTMVHLGHQLRACLRKGVLKKLRAELVEIRETLVQYAERYAELVPRPNPPSIRPMVMLFATTISSLALLSVAFIFYMLLNITLNPEINRDLDNLAEIHVELNEENITNAERTVMRIDREARETHKRSGELLDEYNAGDFKLENQNKRLEVSALLHKFYQARDELLKIGIVFNPNRFDNGSSSLEIFGERLGQLSTAAVLLRHQMSLQFAATYLKDKELAKYLNQPDDIYGIPEGLVRQVNEELNAERYRDLIDITRERFSKEDEERGSNESLNSKGLRSIIDRANEVIKKIDSEDSDPLHGRVRSAISEAKRKSVNTYLELQQVVATKIGDFRIKNTEDIKEHHIPEGKVEEFHNELEPGDILIERRDWYSSNAFLPGYWPHGALYVGTPDDWKEDKDEDENFLRKVIKELKRLVDIEDRNKTDARQTEEDGKTHIQKMRELIEALELVDNENPPDQKMGELIKKLNEKQIIEAVSEGVIHNTIEHSVGGASSVFALRPKKLMPGERAEAVAQAFFYIGRPYDFDFDFDTPNTLVCTEVVYRCYGGNSDEATLKFPLVTLMGRRTLPAHQIAIQFVEDVESGRSQYDLVVWLDHDRINQTAALLKYDGDHSGENFKRFKDTLKRSSITFVMEYKKHGISALVSKQVLYLFYLSVITAICYAIAKFIFFLRMTPESQISTRHPYINETS